MKIKNIDEYFIEVCSFWSNWQYSSIGSDNCLALTRRQAIIWTNDDKFIDAYMCHPASVGKHNITLHKNQGPVSI